MDEYQETSGWERALRIKVAFICMAAVAGKEGDLRHLTDDLVYFCRALSGGMESNGTARAVSKEMVYPRTQL